MAEEEKLLELIGGSHEGILGVVTRAGYPHMTNVLYVWDPEARVARISTTADRVKGRVLRRNPRAALHVAGPHFWAFAVGEGDVETSDIATTPGDASSREGLEIASAFVRELDEEQYLQRMVEERRLVARLRVKRVYGVVRDAPPG
jgi:PPOX class probable F420-dependent enzyme